MQDSKFPEFQGNARFQVVERLGQGGMGIVYEAYDRERQVRVALKTLLRGSAEALRLFKQEFRALQDLRHPNLVKLGELFEDHGQWFFTMELVEGESFFRYVCPLTSNLMDTGSSSRNGSGSLGHRSGSGSGSGSGAGASSSEREVRSDSGLMAALQSGSGPITNPETPQHTADATADVTADVTADAAAAATRTAQQDAPGLHSATPPKSGVVSVDGNTDLSPQRSPDDASVPPIPRRLRSGAFDETRLRASLAQLAHALCFLHASGKVHRDIKPSTGSRDAPQVRRS